MRMWTWFKCITLISQADRWLGEASDQDRLPPLSGACAVRRCESSASAAVRSEEEQLQPGYDRYSLLFIYTPNTDLSKHLDVLYWMRRCCLNAVVLSVTEDAFLWLLDQSAFISITKCVKDALCRFVE